MRGQTVLIALVFAVCTQKNGVTKDWVYMLKQGSCFAVAMISTRRVDIGKCAASKGKEKCG